MSLSKFANVYVPVYLAVSLFGWMLVAIGKHVHDSGGRVCGISLWGLGVSAMLFGLGLFVRGAYRLIVGR